MPWSPVVPVPVLWQISTLSCVCFSPRLAAALSALPFLPSVPLKSPLRHYLQKSHPWHLLSTFFFKLQYLVLSRNPRNSHWIKEIKTIYTKVIFKNLFLYWRIIALQSFVIFCQTSAWISHRYTYIPSLLNLPPISLPTYPSRLIQSPRLSFLSHHQIPIGYLIYIW